MRRMLLKALRKIHTESAAAIGKATAQKSLVYAFLFISAILCASAFHFWRLSAPPLAETARYPGGIILRDSAGEILRVGLGEGEVDCRPFYRTSPSDNIVQALVAAEDRRFYSHAGVDMRAILRASRQNILSGRRISGASTITMQCIRLLQPGRKRTLPQKIIEALQAARLEKHLTKDEILSQYLNRAPFGSNLVGIEAAAQGWFGKAPSQLNLGESALLAGMVQSPTRLRPDRNIEGALRRRSYVLQRMEALGFIDSEQREDAEASPIVLQRSPRPFREPFFCDWAQRGLSPGDYRTSLDPELQAAARAILDPAVTDYDAAALLISVPDGEIRVWHCTGDYFAREAGQVNTVLSPRPAGSALKPFAYALAFDGGLLTPERILMDIPLQFGSYKPANFSDTFRGAVSAREALIRSLNIPALEVARLCGAENFHGSLIQLGFRGVNRPAEHYGLGLVLGNASVSLLELARAYGCLANMGETLPTGPESQQGRRIFSAGASWMIADILGGEERSLDSLGHNVAAGLPRFAWKTGTSSDFRDAWTVAWNSDWVIAVWCGYKSGKGGNRELIGKKAAAPLVWEIARRLPSSQWFSKPAQVAERLICARSGFNAGPLCQNRATGPVLTDRSLNQICPVHIAANSRMAENPPKPDITANSRGQIPDARAFRIESPVAESRYRFIEGLAAQSVLLRATGFEPDQTLTWFCNDRVIGTGNDILWKPHPGDFRIVCASYGGAGADASDTVRIAVERP